MTFVSNIGVVLLLSVGLMACASSSPTSQSGVSSNKIVLTQLSSPVDGMSTYEVVQQYKSHWLQKRGATSINNPVPIKVYLDGTGSPYGSVESLREIRATNVASITHFDAREAQFRFGLGNVAGAILVETKSGKEGS